LAFQCLVMDNQPSAVTFHGVYPIGDTDPLALPVREIGPAVAFYVHVLGFTLAECGDAIAFLTRDAARIGLAANGADPEQASVYFAVSDADALRAEYAAKSLEPTEIRPNEHDGKTQRIFFAKEPYGVCFCFGATV